MRTLQNIVVPVLDSLKIHFFWKTQHVLGDMFGESEQHRYLYSLYTTYIILYTYYNVVHKIKFHLLRTLTHEKYHQIVQIFVK